MEAIAEQTSIYRSDFDTYAERYAGEPQWLGELRRAGIEAFEARGFPHRKEEAWRKTDLSQVLAEHYALPDGAGELDEGLRGEIEALGEACRLVFVDGRLDETLSSLDALPQGLEVTTLARARDEQWVGERLGQLDRRGLHPFIALNTAFHDDGAVVRAPRGKQFETPVELVFVYTAGSDRRMVHPRVLVLAESGSEVRVVERHAGAAEAKYLACPVSEVYADQGAVVDYYRAQRQGDAAAEIAGVHARADRDASLRMHLLAAGGQLARNDVYVDLDGSGAEVVFNGLHLTRERQFCDHHTWFNHNVEHTSSQQTVKGVLDGRSETVFDGLVRVAEGAQKTDAEQQNRNLLMSKLALAHSNPRLEIHADDVKCAHGSTTGQIDDEAIFYLRTRGVGPDDAKGLLIFAFADEMLRPLRIDSLYRYERALLFERLPGDQTLRDAV